MTGSEVGTEPVRGFLPRALLKSVTSTHVNTLCKPGNEVQRGCSAVVPSRRFISSFVIVCSSCSIRVASRIRRHRRNADEYSAELVKNPQGAPPELCRSGRPEYEVDVVALHYLANKAPKKDDHSIHPRQANDEDDDT